MCLTVLLCLSFVGVNSNCTSKVLPILSYSIAKNKFFNVISRSESHGTSFNLACRVQFAMNETCSQCAVEGHWRLPCLFRCKPFFALETVALYYKSHISSDIEYRSLAISYAANSDIELVESVQKCFLETLTTILFIYCISLIWLLCRADAKLLIFVIFRCITRRRLLRPLLFVCSFSCANPRYQFHCYQLMDATRVFFWDYLDRSTFRYVAAFNLLAKCLFHFEDIVVFPVSVSIF